MESELKMIRDDLATIMSSSWKNNLMVLSERIIKWPIYYESYQKKVFGQIQSLQHLDYVSDR